MLDTDIPTAFEARYFRRTLGKLLWVFLQPFFYASRPFLIYPKVCQVYMSLLMKGRNELYVWDKIYIPHINTLLIAIVSLLFNTILLLLSVESVDF